MPYILPVSCFGAGGIDGQKKGGFVFGARCHELRIVDENLNWRIEYES